jgi:hypothetical protein
MAPSCPYLGLIDDPKTNANFPYFENACFGVNPPQRINLSYQDRFCLRDGHIRCPGYINGWEEGIPKSVRQSIAIHPGKIRYRWVPLLLLGIVVLILIVGFSGIIPGFGFFQNKKNASLTPPTMQIIFTPSMASSTISTRSSNMTESSFTNLTPETQVMTSTLPTFNSETATQTYTQTTTQTLTPTVTFTTTRTSFLIPLVTQTPTPKKDNPPTTPTPSILPTETIVFSQTNTSTITQTNIIPTTQTPTPLFGMPTFDPTIRGTFLTFVPTDTVAASTQTPTEEPTDEATEAPTEEPTE